MKVITVPHSACGKVALHYAADGGLHDALNGLYVSEGVVDGALSLLQYTAAKEGVKVFVWPTEKARAIAMGTLKLSARGGPYDADVFVRQHGPAIQSSQFSIVPLPAAKHFSFALVDHGHGTIRVYDSILPDHIPDPHNPEVASWLDGTHASFQSAVRVAHVMRKVVAGTWDDVRLCALSPQQWGEGGRRGLDRGADCGIFTAMVAAELLLTDPGKALPAGKLKFGQPQAARARVFLVSWLLQYAMMGEVVEILDDD